MRRAARLNARARATAPFARNPVERVSALSERALCREWRVESTYLPATRRAYTMGDDCGESHDHLISACRAAVKQLPDAPQVWIRRAVAIWRTSNMMDMVRAALALDSWTDTLPVVRAGGTNGRQMLFTSNLRDVDVRVRKDGRAWTLEGQVLGPTDGGSLDLLSDGLQVYFVELDHLGSFHLDDVVAGRYDVVLHFPDERVLFTLDIGTSVP